MRLLTDDTSFVIISNRELFLDKFWRYREFFMKRFYVLSLILLANIAKPAQEEPDCGLKQFFSKLSDRMYCEAESSSSAPENIKQLLLSATQQFDTILHQCTPAAKHTEEIIHSIAGVGTTGMLERFERTPNFKGVDNISEDKGTPLMSAALHGNIELVETLLQKGANPSTKLTKEINGTIREMTPEMAALKVPTGLFSGGFGAMATLPLIIIAGARHTNYPRYDKDVLEKLTPMYAPLAPFITCAQLINKKASDQSHNDSV